MRTAITLTALIVTLSSLARAAEVEIKDKLMGKGFSKPRPSGANIDMVVLHFSSAVVENSDKPYDVASVIQIYRKAKSSSHYLIDREGKVYRLIPDDRQAFHAGKGEVPAKKKRGSRKDKLNHTSIGIELLAIGTQTEMKKYLTADQYKKIPKSQIGYTQKQYTSLKALLKSLSKSHRGIKLDRNHIIGHDEYARGRKNDPGSLFKWTKIGL